MTGDHTPYCVEGCGRPATTTRIVWSTPGDDATPTMVEPVCVHHGDDRLPLRRFLAAAGVGVALWALIGLVLWWVIR